MFSNIIDINEDWVLRFKVLAIIAGASLAYKKSQVEKAIKD